MRTTLDIDEAVLDAARAIARDEGRSLGAVISDLARRGLVPRERRHDRGLPTFDVPPDAETFTMETVHRALDD